MSAGILAELAALAELGTIGYLLLLRSWGWISV